MKFTFVPCCTVSIGVGSFLIEEGVKEVSNKAN